MNNFTRETFKAFLIRLRAGEVKVDEFKEAYTRLLASKDDIIAELTALPMSKLTNGRGSKKAEVVSRIFSSHYRGTFHLSKGPSIEFTVSFMGGGAFTAAHDKAYQDAVNATTQQHIDDTIAEARARRAENQRILNNPTTYDDFSRLVEAGVVLEPAQKVTWERLQAERSIADAERERTARGAVAAVDLADKKFEVVKGYHTKHCLDIWIVTVSGFLGEEVFREVCSKARSFGGNYSRAYGGNPSGFQFFTEEAAQKFMALQDGSVNRNDPAAEVAAREAAAARLGDGAEKLAASADAELSKERKTNTWKRANAATYAEATARRQASMAETIQNVATAIAAGSAKFLAGIKTAVQIAALESALESAKWRRSQAMEQGWEACKARDLQIEDVDFAVYPWPTVSQREIQHIADVAMGCKGGVLRGKRLIKLVGKLPVDRKAEDPGDNTRRFDTHTDVQLLKECFGFLDTRYHYLIEAFQIYDRIRRAGIDSEAFLKTALREYFPLRGDAVRADPIKMKERQLVGTNIAGFFPTPRTLIQHMLELAKVQPLDHILEPSAGKGDIVDAIKETNPTVTVDCVECNSTLREILTLKGYSLVGDDILSPAMDEFKETYDVVLMNPPFEGGADWRHTMRAFEMLKPGGRLVSIVAAGIMTGDYANAVNFRTWLDSVDAEVEQNPEGSFATAEAFRTTSVSTYTLWITKP